MIRHTKPGRLIPILPWFELYFEKWPKIISRSPSRTPQRWKKFFSSQIKNKLEALYGPTKSRFLVLKFRKYL